jgi:hypothetical protein
LFASSRVVPGGVVGLTNCGEHTFPRESGLVVVVVVVVVGIDSSETKKGKKATSCQSQENIKNDHRATGLSMYGSICSVINYKLQRNESSEVMW